MGLKCQQIIRSPVSRVAITVGAWDAPCERPGGSHRTTCRGSVWNLDLVDIGVVGDDFDVHAVARSQPRFRDLHVDLIQPGQPRREPGVAGVTGGEMGLTLADILSIDATTNYDDALIFMVVVGAILFFLSRSSVGLILQASGQDAVEAAALGFNVTKHKIAAFCISALFSGLTGALLVSYLGTASVSGVVDIAVGVQVLSLNAIQSNKGYNSLIFKIFV